MAYKQKGIEVSFLELAEKRYSSRGFDANRQIEPEKLEKILRAGQLAPTGRNAQPFKILVLQSKEALKIAEECTPCVYGAPTVLLVIYDDRHEESHLKENDVNIGLVDATIVATYLMNEAEEQGLGSCYVELFYGDKTKQRFNLPKGWEPACFLPIGYSTAEPGPRHFTRKPLDDLVKYC